jgi:hypothetical protein
LILRRLQIFQLAGREAVKLDSDGDFTLSVKAKEQGEIVENQQPQPEPCLFARVPLSVAEPVVPAVSLEICPYTIRLGVL